MAFPHSDSYTSDALGRLAEVRDSIQGGNWSAAESMARSLSGCLLPVTKAEREDYLTALKQTVVLAKASRSVAAAKLARVHAASRFQSGVHLTGHRQNYGDAAVFSQSQAPSPPTPSTT